LDVRAGELREHDIKIRLQEQPLRILIMLLEQPGRGTGRYIRDGSLFREDSAGTPGPFCRPPKKKELVSPLSLMAHPS
jgi:hypothetical protein